MVDSGFVMTMFLFSQTFCRPFPPGNETLQAFSGELKQCPGHSELDSG